MGRRGWAIVLIVAAMAGWVSWRLCEFAPRSVLELPPKEVDVTIAPNGRYVALSEHNGDGVDFTFPATVTLWDATAGRLVARLIESAMSVGFPAFSRDGRFVAAATDPEAGPNVIVHVWETGTGRETAALDVPRDRVQEFLGFTPENRVISGGMTSSWDAYQVWDAASGRLLHSLAVPEFIDRRVCYRPDGSSHVLAMDSKEKRQVYDLATGKHLSELTPLFDVIDYPWDLASLGAQIVVTERTRDPRVEFQRANTGEWKTLYRGESFGKVALSGDGRFAAVYVHSQQTPLAHSFGYWWWRLTGQDRLGGNDEVRVCETDGGREVGRLRRSYSDEYQSWRSLPKFSDDGSVVAVFNDQSIELYDMPLRKPLGLVLATAGIAGAVTYLLLRLHRWRRGAAGVASK
jgi:WD40 repeat protein